MLDQRLVTCLGHNPDDSDGRPWWLPRAFTDIVYPLGTLSMQSYRSPPPTHPHLTPSRSLADLSLIGVTDSPDVLQQLPAVFQKVIIWRMLHRRKWRDWPERWRKIPTSVRDSIKGIRAAFSANWITAARMVVENSLLAENPEKFREKLKDSTVAAVSRTASKLRAGPSLAPGGIEDILNDAELLGVLDDASGMRSPPPSSEFAELPAGIEAVDKDEDVLLSVAAAIYGAIQEWGEGGAAVRAR